MSPNPKEFQGKLLFPPGTPILLTDHYSSFRKVYFVAETPTAYICNIRWKGVVEHGTIFKKMMWSIVHKGWDGVAEDCNYGSPEIT